MTYEEARDSMFTLVKAALQGGGYLILWPDIPEETPGTGDTYIRVRLQHETGGDASIGGRLMDRLGTLFVQIFTPAGDGNTLAYQIAKTVGDAFQGVRVDSLWFRNTRINERQSPDAWGGVNVLVDFQYEELRA